MHAINSKRFHHATRRGAGEDHSNPTVPVSRPPDLLVETADVEKAIAPHNDVPEDEVPVENRCALVLDVEGPVARVATPHHLTVDLQIGIARDDVEVRAGRRKLRKLLEPGR